MSPAPAGWTRLADLPAGVAKFGLAAVNGKLIVAGADREEAMRRSAAALAACDITGISTTVPFHRALLRHPAFARGEIHTRWVEQELVL